MVKLDPAHMSKLDAWSSFRKASDEHTVVRHESTMKRKRDELKFELYSKCHHTILAVFLLDENASIVHYKRHTTDK